MTGQRFCALQRQFIAELADPLGVPEGSHEHSEFVLIEAADEREQRAIGLELGLLFPAEIVPRMTEIVLRGLARHPGTEWRVPGLVSMPRK